MKLNNYFVYDGRPSTDFNLLISGLSTWDSSEYDSDAVSIPGKNGDMHNGLGRLKNFTLPYKDSYIASHFKRFYPDLRAFLMAHSDKYYRLEDTYHPNEYLMAKFSDTLEVDYDAYNDCGKFDIKFNCMPQHWLKSGEIKKVYDSGNSADMNNPTYFTARPLIRAYGNGTLTVGDVNVLISSCPYGYIDLDSDIYDAYYEDENCNKYIETTNYEFPVLKPGINKIRWSSGITKIEVIPRWWTQ